MIPEMYIEIIDKLADKTREKEINWKPSSQEKIFLVNFPSFSISIREVYYIDVQRRKKGRIEFNVINDDGDKIDSFSVNEDDVQWQHCHELYSGARRIALGIEEAVKKIKDELKKDGVVGEKLTPPWDRPEIPF